MMMPDGNLDAVADRLHPADLAELRRWQAFLRTRKMLREAVARHGLDSPQASALRYDLIRMMHEFKTGDS